MNKPNTDLIQGTLDTFFLKTLSLEALHGFGIARRMNSAWCQTDKARRAKYYSLTRTGRKQLELETADWTRRASAIARLLKAGA